MNCLISIRFKKLALGVRCEGRPARQVIAGFGERDPWQNAALRVAYSATNSDHRKRPMTRGSRICFAAALEVHVDGEAAPPKLGPLMTLLRERLS